MFMSEKGFFRNQQAEGWFGNNRVEKKPVPMIACPDAVRPGVPFTMKLKAGDVPM